MDSSLSDVIVRVPTDGTPSRPRAGSNPGARDLAAMEAAAPASRACRQAARSLPTAGRNRAATTAVGVPHNPEEEPEPQGEVINQIAAVLTEEEAAPAQSI